MESVSRLRLASLYRAAGQAELALQEESEIERCARVEAGVLCDSDRVYVCSQLDRMRLRQRQGRADVRVLPNAVPIPPTRGLPRREEAPFTFLFVGTLGYYPNQDAVLSFCAEVLPRIRAAAPRRFQVQVVGSGAHRDFARQCLRRTRDPSLRERLVANA